MRRLAFIVLGVCAVVCAVVFPATIPGTGHGAAAPEPATQPAPAKVVAALLAALQDPEAAVRLEAATALRVIEPPVTLLFPACLPALEDPDRKVRIQLLQLMEKLGPEARPAIPGLVRNIRSGRASPYTKMALRAMGPPAIPPLMEVLEDDTLSPLARRVATEALFGIMNRAGRAAKEGNPSATIDPIVLDWLVQQVSSDDVHIRREALTAVGWMGEHAHPAVPLLVDRLAADTHNPSHTLGALKSIGPAAAQYAPETLRRLDSADPHERKAAALALGIIGQGTDGVASALEHALTDLDPAVRAAAAEGLSTLWADDAEALKAGVNHLDPNLRAEVNMRLGYMAIGHRTPAEDAISPVLQLLQDPRPEVRIKGVRQVANLAIASVYTREGGVPPPKPPSAASVSLLLEGLEAALDDPEPTVREEVVFYLEMCAPFFPEVTQLIISALSDPDGSVRKSARGALVALGPEATAPATKTLIGLLRHDDPVTCAGALGLLTTLDPPAAAAVPVVFEGMREGRRYDRRGGWIPSLGTPSAVAAAVSRMGAGAVPHLRAELHSDDPTTQWVALSALGRIGRDAAAAIPDVIPFLSSAEPRVQEQAVSTLAWLGAPPELVVGPITQSLGAAESLGQSPFSAVAGALEPNAVPLLVKALQANDAHTRLGAVRALGQMKAKARAATEALVAATEVTDPQVRAMVVWVLGDVDPDPRLAVPRLTVLLADADCEVRNRAARALGSVHTNSDAVSALAALIHDPCRDARYGAAVAILLLSRKFEVPTALGLAMLADSDSYVRGSAIHIFAQKGLASVPALLAALEHENPHARRAAATALGKIYTPPDDAASSGKR